METSKNIKKLTEDTLDSLESIQEVKVPAFFKERTMQLMFSEKTDQQSNWSWFTPKLQLATLAIIVVLNIMAFYQSDARVQEETVVDFAESNDLFYDEESIVFN